jgi:hypothetical protein
MRSIARRGRDQAKKKKAKAQEKRASEKETDEAYKAAIGKIPDAKQTADPWSNMRGPAPTR